VSHDGDAGAPLLADPSSPEQSVDSRALGVTDTDQMSWRYREFIDRMKSVFAPGHVQHLHSLVAASRGRIPGNQRR
jgi:hypothetical protein